MESVMDGTSFALGLAIGMVIGMAMGKEKKNKD